MKLHTSFIVIFLLSCSFALNGQDFYDTSTITDDDDEQNISVSNAPLAKGNFMIGTGIGFSTASSQVEITSESSNFDGQGGEYTQLNLSPSLGYFFTRNFAFGLNMDYVANWSSTPEDFTNPEVALIESNNTDLLFGPLARVYFPFGGDKAFFLSATLGFGSSTDEFVSEEGVQIVDNDLFTTGVGPGFTVIADDGLALEAIVKYNYTRSESNVDIDGVTRNTITNTNAFDFSVGIRYYFGGFTSINE